jgi:hypothetical protein
MKCRKSEYAMPNEVERRGNSGNVDLPYLLFHRIAVDSVACHRPKVIKQLKVARIFGWWMICNILKRFC